MSGRDGQNGVIDLVPDNLTHLDPRIRVPRYDREQLGAGIVHIGVGGFHRAHQAEYLDDLCNDGLRDWSITGVGVLAGDSQMASALLPQHGLYTLVTRSQEETTIRVIGTIVDYLHAASNLNSLIQLLAAPTTRIVSLTVTEGGYPVDPTTGEAASASSSAAFVAIATALDRRRTGGLPPFTVVSCDNILQNGDVTRAATLGAASELVGHDTDWIEREVPFPNSMVDRITPATSDADRKWLQTEYGVHDRWPVVTEPFRQWVIEDRFAAGRPPWEEVGALITADVTPYERLKLRVLNAGHSTMAYLAALAGFELVAKVMADRDFSLYLRRFLDAEAGPVLPPVPGVDVESYKSEVIERFSNPAISDQVSRLCLDGSSKFPTFLLPTIEAQLARGGSIDLSTLALAGWCQYLLGIDDFGHELEIADDPRKERAIEFAQASQDDPLAFLDFSDVFGRVSEVIRFRESFARALNSLRTVGTRATLGAWLSS